MAPLYAKGLQAINPAAFLEHLPALRNFINDDVRIRDSCGNRPEQTLREVDLLSEWVRLLPNLRIGQLSAVQDVIMHKVTTISNSPITGDESQQLAVLHRLIKLQREFSNYHGENCHVEEMIDNRLKHLVRAQRLELSRVSILAGVTKVHRISLMFIRGAITDSTHGVPDVWSLVLSHTRTQYRVVGYMNGGTFFNGITLALDSAVSIGLPRTGE
ncbi:MAG: hypothetical protein Q9191_001907 [Dirinaria sp. TL-2023a]